MFPALLSKFCCFYFFVFVYRKKKTERSSSNIAYFFLPPLPFLKLVLTSCLCLCVFTRLTCCFNVSNSSSRLPTKTPLRFVPWLSNKLLLVRLLILLSLGDVVVLVLVVLVPLHVVPIDERLDSLL